MVIRHRPPTGTIATIGIQTIEDGVDGSPYANVPLQLPTGTTVAIVGPNGAGKSALMGEIVRGLRGQSDVEQFSGYRQINFQSDDVDQVGQSLATFQTQISQPVVNRMRNPWGEQHLRSVVKRIIDRQHQDSHDMLEAVRSGIGLGEAEGDHALILDELNGVFEAARLEVRVILTGGTLKAQNGGHVYGLDRMSDGERAALLLVGAILVRPINGRIAIDEPERHLNRAIAGPLIAAAVRARPDVGYVFATHELDLLKWLNPSEVLHVSRSEVVMIEPEVRRYKLESIGNTNLPSESLRTAVYGSRKALMLVEGTESSSDEALYRLIYVGWDVVGRGGWESVTAEVRAMNRNVDLHWLKTAGIIDGDGREGEEIATLLRDDIYSLPCPTIENLFFVGSVVEAMIKRSFDLNGGKSVTDRLTDYQAKALETINIARSDIVDRRTTWRANRTLASRKTSVRSVREGQQTIKSIDLCSIRDEVTAQVVAALSNGNVHDIIMNMPIKNTRVPAALSEEIGFPSFPAYKQAVMHQMQSGTPEGVAITETLRALLPTLPLP